MEEVGVVVSLEVSGGQVVTVETMSDRAVHCRMLHESKILVSLEFHVSGCGLFAVS